MRANVAHRTGDARTLGVGAPGGLDAVGGLDHIAAQSTAFIPADWITEGEEKIAAWDPQGDLEQRVANYEKNIERIGGRRFFLR